MRDFVALASDICHKNANETLKRPTKNEEEEKKKKRTQANRTAIRFEAEARLRLQLQLGVPSPSWSWSRSDEVQELRHITMLPVACCTLHVARCPPWLLVSSWLMPWLIRARYVNPPTILLTNEHQRK